MQLEYLKILLAAGWILAMGVAVVSATPASVSGWTLFACAAVIPPLVMFRRWNHPPETMAESIQKVLH